MEVRIVIDDRIVNAWRRVRAVATRPRLALGSACAVLGSAVLAAAAPLAKPHEFTPGQAAVAAEVNENFDALYGAFNARVVREDLTIPIAVGEGCAGLKEALAALDEKIIASTVTIDLAAGTYACASAIHIRHANGDRIEIAGGGNSPNDVILTFPADTGGVVVTSSAALGGLSNLTLKGGDGTSGGIGVLADNASVIGLRDVVVRDFQRGVLSQHGSSITGSNVTVESNAHHGVEANRASVILLDDATSTANGGYGFYSTEGAQVTCITCAASSNAASGFIAYGGASLTASNATSSSNGTNGFYSHYHATVILTSPTAADNAGTGFGAAFGGYMHRSGTIQASGNGQATNLAPNTPSASHGAVIND